MLPCNERLLLEAGDFVILQFIPPMFTPMFSPPRSPHLMGTSHRGIIPLPLLCCSTTDSEIVLDKAAAGRLELFNTPRSSSPGNNTHRVHAAEENPVAVLLCRAWPDPAQGASHEEKQPDMMGPGSCGEARNPHVGSEKHRRHTESFLFSWTRAQCPQTHDGALVLGQRGPMFTSAPGL